MFANFFGIVIISASALLIAGLILRPTPDLPATMNLGMVKTTSDTAQQAASVDASNSAESSATTASSSSSDSENASTDATAVQTQTAVETKTGESSETAKVDSAEIQTVATESTEAKEVETPETAREAALRKRNLEIRRKAAEAARNNGTVRVNKSDFGRVKDN